MICPKCQGKTLVCDSREREDRVWRRRKCKECGFHFETFEDYAKNYNAPKAFIKIGGVLK